jgi:sarcosine oxidase
MLTGRALELGCSSAMPGRSASMKSSYDVLIAGGGVVGSSIAYHLAAEPTFGGSVLVVERDPTYQSGSTGRSWGGIRQQFSTPESVAMSGYALELYRNVAEYLGVDGEAPDLAYREQGYLLLLDEASIASVRACHERQREQGAAVQFLDVEAVSRQFPELATDGIAGASYGYPNEGWIDPASLLHAFRRKARHLGVEYLADEVAGLTRDADRVTGARLRAGGPVHAGVVVIAAGAHSAAIAASVDIALPVGPQKLCTFVFDCRREVRHAPLTVDVSGLMVRPEGRGFITAIGPEPAEQPFTFDLDVDYEVFERRIWPLLAHRFPAFEAIKMQRAWAGYIDYNHFDSNAIIGSHPGIEGVLFATGFHGHGVMHSPAAGRAVMELIALGGYRSLDLTRFGYARVLAGEPLVESYVFGETEATESRAESEDGGRDRRTARASPGVGREA